MHLFDDGDLHFGSHFVDDRKNRNCRVNGKMVDEQKMIEQVVRVDSRSSGYGHYDR